MNFAYSPKNAIPNNGNLQKYVPLVLWYAGTKMRNLVRDDREERGKDGDFAQDG